MRLCHGFLPIKAPQFLFRNPFPNSVSLSLSTSSKSQQVELSETLQYDTLKSLEWGSVCKQVAAFTSTSMGSAVARNGSLPLGRTPDESRILLEQTTAAMLLPRPLDFSGLEDVSEIVDSSVSGESIRISEICMVKRTLEAARGLLQQLEDVALEDESSERFSPLLDILRNCNPLMQLEQKIGFCIDCNFFMILDRASEELELIRSERKRNMENLDSLLKRVSAQIFQAGAIDRPLVTKRRSRMCVGVRASHRSLLPDGVVLNVSSSGVTYFIEPEEAVELNNMEVRLSDSEKAEELALLSFLTSEIAEAEMEIKYLLDRVLEVDLALAKAAHARWVNGVCPILCLERCEGFESNRNDSNDYSLLVDIEGIQHPLLLESSLRSLSDKGNSVTISERLSGVANFPIPIDIRIGCGTKVVVISGPNTGGKTASMKTLGLASLMLKAGMYVPAKKCPKIPWFDLVLSDIGDQQSLEQNLSTFSGHISRICKILEVASKESLVLIDEIGCGTDPSEGVALSASILHYLKDRVKLAVVTTHYADLTRLKEKDARFENAAMEFSMETLQPTYQLLWGSVGDSNALNIAKSIGFDSKIIERAKMWIEKLMPEKQQERKSLLYQSLVQERNRLETQARAAAALHSEIMDLYHEVNDEAEDLGEREVALKAKASRQIQHEIQVAKSRMETVVKEFESQLKTASADQYNLLIKKSESAIASIVEAYCPSGSVPVREVDSYTPQFGEQVRVKGLGDKLATVVEPPGDDGTVLVQYGKMRVRVNKNNIRGLANSEKSAASSSVANLKRQGGRSKNLRKPLEANNGENASYGPLVQTSKNTVDLRGMRAEEASRHLDLAISTRKPHSVIFIVHGMGTGVVKGCALEVLRNHPRVAKFEQESPMNHGCTIAYID